jgi:hypothetical protein
VRKLSLLLCGVLLIFVFGCSGSPGVAPDRQTMDDFFAGLELPDSVPGYFSISDLDGNIAAEGTLVLNEDGSYTVGEVRNGEITIDLTWLCWICCCWTDYLNPAGYTPDGRSLYYIGTTMEYKTCFCNCGPCICNGNVLICQRYWGGPKHGELLPGASCEGWYGIFIPHGLNCFEDDYYIPYGTLPGNAVTWLKVWFSFNWWCLHFDIILFDCCCGLWDP